MVELGRLELLTFRMRTERSPKWSTKRAFFLIPKISTFLPGCEPRNGKNACGSQLFSSWAVSRDARNSGTPSSESSYI